MSRGVVDKGTFWAFVPVGLLGGLIATVLAMVHVAIADPSFAVESRYYARALSWDEHLAAERRSAALGWRAEVSAARVADGVVDLRLVLTDRAGSPVKGARVELEGFPVARSRGVVRAGLVEGPEGTYSVKLAAQRGGLWEFQIDATTDRDRFTTTLRRDVPELAAP